MHYQNIKGRRHPGSVWNAGRKALFFIIAVLSASGLTAQEYPNGLSADSVDPHTDSLFINQMREKMNLIRRTEKRPTVALVLSGGGAKGSAHVGVRKFIDELGIPVDMICGTSMGGLMGGLMSLGYDSEFLDSLLKAQDWSITLTDKIDPKYMPFENKLYRSKYFLTLPFHYENGNRRKQDSFNINAGGSDGEKKSINSLIPSGYVYGFNVNNFLSSLSVGYQDSISFAELPTPFFCVAADIVSCKAKNFGSGPLNTALRSTMSIPGLFDPVRYEGMVLIDGGTRNNFPTDLARAMGADYIIGCELSNSKPDFDQIKNLGSMMMQMITMLGKDAYDKNVGGCDVYIKPELEGFGMLSFNPESIDTLISRGYKAAELKKDELLAIREMTGETRQKPDIARATDLQHTPVQISEISFEGLSDDESLILMRKIKLKAGQTVSKEDMDAAMAKLQGSGAFESVTYSLLGAEEPYKLKFNCVKGRVNRLGIGLRVDTEEWAVIGLNLGLGTQKLKGSSLNIDARVGINQFASIRYSLDLPKIPTINIEAGAENVSGTVYTGAADNDKNHTSSKVKSFVHNEAIYFSNLSWRRLDMKIGVKSTFVRNNGIWDIAGPTAVLINDKGDGRHMAAFFRQTTYTLDDNYYPTKGFSLGFNYDFEFTNFNSGFVPVHILAFNYRQPIRIGQKVALIPSINARFLFNHESTFIVESPNNDACAYYNNNLIGGAMAGRYVPHQIAFAGFNSAYSAADKIICAHLELRVNPVGDFFISAIGGAFKDSDNLEGLIKHSNTAKYGAALELGWNTLFGPLKAKVQWSNFTRRFEFHMSAGFDF